MSTFNVNLTEVKDVLTHPNAERLEILKIYDCDVVAQKGVYQRGDRVIYCPLDSILTEELENIVFSPVSKIKLNKRRIRQIKLRGHPSQGMAIRPDSLDSLFGPNWTNKIHLETDLKEKLGITKYEPPESSLPPHMGVKTSKKIVNKNFRKYSEIENIKYFDRIFQDGEQVYVSEKLHGTSFRAGWFKNEPNTLWKKIKNFFGRLEEYEFCWGSRTVQIQNKLYHKGYYETDVYTKMVNKYSLKYEIPKGMAFYGEIVGAGIQKGFNYACKEDHVLYVYDILDTKENRWLNHDEFTCFMDNTYINRVPELYVGPYKREIIDQYRDGKSTLDNNTVREGVVIKPTVERESRSLGRVVLKYVSPDYYDVQNKIEGTEFH